MILFGLIVHDCSFHKPKQIFSAIHHQEYRLTMADVTSFSWSLTGPSNF